MDLRAAAELFGLSEKVSTVKSQRSLDSIKKANTVLETLIRSPER